MKKYIVQDIETKKLYAWSLQSILREINRDRSNEFTDYNSKDWREGWYNMGVEGDTYNLLGVVRI